jgi:hypothetical protein
VKVTDSWFEVVGAGVGLGWVGFRTGFSPALTATPLLHTSFLPDLTQVCLIAAYVIVCPCFEHAVPGFTAAFAKGVIVASTSALTAKSTTFLRIEQLCGTKIKYF